MIHKVLVEWGPMMASCSLSFYAGDASIGGLTIRPEAETSGWQQKLAPLDKLHGQEVGIDQVRTILPENSKLKWAQTRAGLFNMIELSGRGDGLWLAFIKRGAPVELATVVAELAKIRDFVLRA